MEGRLACNIARFWDRPIIEGARSRYLGAGQAIDSHGPTLLADSGSQHP